MNLYRNNMKKKICVYLYDIVYKIVFQNHVQNKKRYKAKSSTEWLYKVGLKLNFTFFQTK